MTSDGISSLEEFPESLVILGAGVIGCEFATIFSNFGKTKVHIISKEDRILPFEDPDLAKVIESNLKANGVLIHHESKLDKMEALGELIKAEPHTYIFKKGIPKEFFKKLETPMEYPGLGSYKDYYKMLSGE